MRSITASVLLCFCALSFLQAPAAHTHALVSDHDHHNFELAHLHAATHPATPSNGPELHSPDPASDMRSVDWFLSANLSSPEQDAEVAQICLTDPLINSELLRPTPLVRSHDPPHLLGLPVRAPPSIPA